MFTTVTPAFTLWHSATITDWKRPRMRHGIRQMCRWTRNRKHPLASWLTLSSFYTRLKWFLSVEHIFTSPAGQQEEHMHYSSNTSIVKYLLISNLPQDLFQHTLIIRARTYCKCKSVIQSSPLGFVILRRLCPTTKIKRVTDFVRGVS